ncbi:type III effector [Nocardioides sp. NPDC047086]|uniref:type III effector n=1 Tax=Nocardioides sp. NPDC047086 TaxID=3154810 RepID=UPI0033F62D0F
MSKKTGLLRRAAAVAAFSGVAFALTTGAATAAPVDDTTTAVSTATSDLSPSSQKAWEDFILGGSYITGGAAQMVSGAWVGAPGLILAGATGSPLTPEQLAAWENWDEGGHKIGEGAAMMVAGAYVGAPGIILDQIAGGATPSDLSPSELEQVTFLIPQDSPALDGVSTDQIPNPMAPLGSF